MTIVITGASGNVGRPLVAELAAAGAPVRAVTRTPKTTRFPRGVEVVGSVADALPGASAVFLNSRALAEDLPGVVTKCVDAGVTKLVALSAINADDDFSRQPSRFRGDRNKEVESLAIDSGLAWVSLRPSVFTTNFAGMWSAQIRAGDVVTGPYAEASSAPIVESDISAVAAHALLTDERVGQQIPLTGPQTFTNAELVEVIGTVLGRPLRSSAWASPPRSPTPMWRCSPRRSTSPPSSPSTWKRSLAGPPSRSRTGFLNTVPCSPSR